MKICEICVYDMYQNFLGKLFTGSSLRRQRKMSSNAKEKIVLGDLLLLFILVAFMALPIAIAEEVPAGACGDKCGLSRCQC